MENLRLGLEGLGHQVFLFVPKAKEYPYSAQVKIIDFPSLNLRIKGFHLPLPITFSLKIGRAIEKIKPEIIHTQHPFYIGESAYFYAKKYKIPLVFTFHTQYDQYTLTYLPFLPKKATLRLVNRYLFNFASRCQGVIAPIAQIKEKYLRNLPVPLTTIPSGINLERFKEKAKLSKKSLGISSDVTVLITTGRLAEEKNLQFLIRAFKLINQKNPKTIFLIVGDGPSKEKLINLTKKLDLKSKIIFTGEIPFSKIADYYKIADIFLYSCLTDVQPQTIIEAAAAKLAIVAINTPDRGYLLKHQENSLLTPNDKEIFAREVLKLCRDTNLLKRLGQNAWQTSKNFSYNESAQKVILFYEKIINSYHRIESIS